MSVMFRGMSVVCQSFLGVCQWYVSLLFSNVSSQMLIFAILVGLKSGGKSGAHLLVSDVSTMSVIFGGMSVGCQSFLGVCQWYVSHCVRMYQAKCPFWPF